LTKEDEQKQIVEAIRFNENTSRNNTSSHTETTSDAYDHAMEGFELKMTKLNQNAG
jgi:hypothetical protein